ncbi:EAL domain-containing protein [Marinobacter sp. X15-166B]|uniref:EAL domain-containing protein n=1 Tax=Marinobacter sp. X15-166B TaxID=1897620 RepID=UPI00085BB768|nr:EAL domain-containing protein [Marinobacter sp. X15-166B]OEY66577.1 hypothetical protein BG841_08995 [Marinobacter sp. X15-166B]
MTETNPELCVLLIDDDEQDYQVIRNQLQHTDRGMFRLIWRNTAAAGLAALRAEAVDVVLAGQRLGTDGVQSLIQKARSEGLTTPFILLLGLQGGDLHARIAALGASDYLRKEYLGGPDLISRVLHAVEQAAAIAQFSDSEAQYRLLFESSPAPKCLVEPQSGRVLSMNAAAQRLYGYGGGVRSIAGLRWGDLCVDPSPGGTVIDGVVLQAGATLELHRTSSGQELFVEVLAAPIVINRRARSLRVLKDLTQQVAHSQQLRLFKRCIEASSNGIIIADARQPDMPVVYVNPSFERITGYDRAEVQGRNCRFLQHDHADPMNEPALADIRKALKEGTEVSGVLRNYRKDGSTFWNELYLTPVTDDTGQLTHVVGIQNDISARRDIEQRLAYHISHDLVTRLPNRMLLEDRLPQACQFARRHGRHIGVLMVGLDGFEQINGAFGHRVGDQVLVETARRLMALVRSGDTVARINGDEFVVLLTDLAQPRDIMIPVEKMHLELARPYRLGSETVHLTACIGITVSDASPERPMELVQQASLAMVRAKQTGKNINQWFCEDFNAETSLRMKLRNELQSAINKQTLTLHYQPIINAQTGRVEYVEALARWPHPVRGMLEPAEFIPLAEETGQIVELGTLVLNQACRDIAALHEAGFRDCAVAVNVSPKQIQKPGFPDVVSRALKANGLTPEALELETVESALLNYTDRAVQTLHELRDLGVRIAIDDFGTGFSSLSYIKLLPVSKIKIDRSFVKDVIHSPSDAAITQSVISMGHHLSLVVVAEGVETEAQAAFLRRQKCDLLQGFVFARPMPFAELKRYLSSSRAVAGGHSVIEGEVQKTLLLLDDEENILRALNRVLRRDGYRILSTTSVQEAFNLLAENEVQVILSDQRMAEMSGTEFFRQVKELYPNTVRIVLSGYTDLRSVTEAINQGAIYRFVTKPWDDRQIREHIQQAFRYREGLH